ncbi:acid-activated urea channel [Spirochaetia bacterium]|nr:acid-activated urea channel [Spirochaetia bacterium]
MGFLGLCLLFVGIALVMNGVAALSKWDAKTTAFINLVTGTILVIGNFIGLFKADPASADPASLMDYNNAAGGFLFGFTYLFIAANYLLKLDLRAFGWYSVCVVVFAVISTVVCVQGGAASLGVLWAAWAVLWLEGFLQLSLNIPALGKVFPYLSILEGLLATGGPGVLMLFGWWK